MLDATDRTGLNATRLLHVRSVPPAPPPGCTRRATSLAPLVDNRYQVAWDSARVGPTYDVLAPDGSEIRLLVQTHRASMVHCTLQPGQVSRAVRHQTVDELWFCVSGRGQVWRKSAEIEETLDVERGVALNIPVGVSFQFRASGAQPLEVVIVTIPPWPGAQEPMLVSVPWPVPT